MINNITLTGFKSFVSESIDFGKLTLLTGLNSSGKSSIMQSLLLLEKAAHKENLFLEGHGHTSEWKNSYSESLSVSGNFDDDKIISIDHDTITITDSLEFPEIIYISADRFGPETSVPIYVDSNKLGRKGQNIFKCIEFYENIELKKALQHEKSQGVTFLFNLQAWLSVISPNVEFKSTIEVMSDSSFGMFNGHRAKNVGFGLSYALPVITALLLGSITPNCIVMIENPEAHLHPKGQTEIARLIALCVEVGVQVVIETHSDHLFDGIRIYTKNNSTNFHELVKIYWFELDKNNNTEVQRANLDENGRLNEWPAGLFDQFGINAAKLL
jgi:predicted ATPase